MTFPAGQPSPMFNLITRTVVVQDDHLLLTRWQSSYYFLIGGRIQHGERLEQAAEREFLEETGVTCRVRQLLYFHEHFFGDRVGESYHELGWYYLVEPEAPVLSPGESLPNPDAEGLTIEMLPLDRLSLNVIYPQFLPRYLPQDAADHFAGCPRHLISVEEDGREHTVELEDLGGAPPFPGGRWQA